MAKEKEKPKPEPKAEALNEEAMKGVWVDGLGFWIGRDYVVLEGVIDKPRTEKRYIVTRIMFPRRVLESLTRTLEEALKKRKELEKKRKTKKVKQ